MCLSLALPPHLNSNPPRRSDNAVQKISEGRTKPRHTLSSNGFAAAVATSREGHCSHRSDRQANYPAQDYGRLFDHTRAAGVGVVGIRVLAGGALSGSTERHPIASQRPEPIGTAMSYDADVARPRRLMPLVKEGFAASLAEAATRFALSHPAMGTILVGMATPQQFEDALAAVQKGPLPGTALDRLTALRQTFSGEPR
jgi:aryl-alcohol dehydrogenase-like predicted oxidoreductase